MAASHTKYTYLYIGIFSLFLVCIYLNSPVVEEFFYPHVSTSVGARSGKTTSPGALGGIIMGSLVGGFALFWLFGYVYSHGWFEGWF